MLGFNAFSAFSFSESRLPQERDGASVVQASASTSASARRVPEGSALINGTSQTIVNTTANGSRVRESASAVASIASLVVSAKFTAKGTAASTASASTTADVERVRENAQEISTQGSTNASGERVRLVSASEACSSEVSVVPSCIFNRSAAIDALATVLSGSQRVRASTGAVNAELSFVASAREKWENIAEGNETWTVVAKDGDIWTPVATDPETWTEVV